MSREPRMRVAITRDEELDGPLARALRSEGLEPVACQAVRSVPPVTLAPLERAARALERYDWLVCSSRRAVQALVEARGGRRFPATLRTAAVGESTAAELQLAGARHVLAGDEAGANGLLSLLSAVDRWQDRAVLMPRAEQGSRLIAETLRGLGARVDEVVAYRTVPRPFAEITSSWRRADPAAAVVTSPSAAQALVQALGAAPLRGLDAVIAIGPTTAAALACLGVPALVSPHADFASVALRTRHALERIARVRDRFSRLHPPDTAVSWLPSDGREAAPGASFPRRGLRP